MKTIRLLLALVASVLCAGMAMGQQKRIAEKPTPHDGLPDDNKFPDLYVYYRQIGNGGAWMAKRPSDGAGLCVEYWTAGSNEQAVNDCLLGWPWTTTGLPGRMSEGSYSGRVIGDRVWSGNSLTSAMLIAVEGKPFYNALPSTSPMLVAVHGKLVYNAWILDLGSSTRGCDVFPASRPTISTKDLNLLEDLLISAIHND